MDRVNAVAVERIVCWLNKWGDEDKHREAGRSDEWIEGYRAATQEQFDRLSKAAPSWIETWRSEKHGNRRTEVPA